MRKKLFCLLFSVVMCFSCVNFMSACNKEPDAPPKTNNNPYVTKVEIQSNPDKVDYIEGEIFEPAGLKFTATWMIKGKERAVKHTKSVCNWTHRDEPLTPDINKIVFTIKQTDYNFEIPISVTASSATGLSVNKGNIKENYIEGDSIDLTQIIVSTKVGNEYQQLSAGSYKLYDNASEITATNNYRLTAGDHVFKAAFGSNEASFTVKAWGLTQLKVTELVVKNTNFGSLIFAGQSIDLTKIAVEKILKDDGGTVEFTRAVTDYRLTDGAEEIAPGNRSAYVLTAGTHTFTVSADGISKSFTVSTAEYDSLVIERKGGNGNSVALNTAFYANYAVYMAKASDPSQRSPINKGDYTVTAKRNGSAVEGVTEENVFGTEGEVEVTVTYRSLRDTVTVKVNGAITINTANMVFTKNLPLDSQGKILRDADGNVVNADGSDFTTTVPGAGNSYALGKSFLEVPPNGGSYGEVGVYDNPGHVGNIKAGQKLVFHIWSERTATANLVIYAASMNFADSENWDGEYPTETSAAYYQPTVTEDVRFNSGISATYDNGNGETPLEVGDDVIVPGYTSQITTPNGQKCDLLGRYYDNRIWTAWSPVIFGAINLTEGDNIVTLTVNINQLNIGLLEVQFTD